MSIFFKFLFERLTDPLGLPVNILTEYIILGIIGTIAYFVAFRIVGNLYHEGALFTRTGGSLVHWLIRLLFFVAIWAVTYGVIWIGKLVVAHWIITVVCFSIAIFVGVIISLFVHNKRKGGVSNA